jgi:cell wall assembly regulator SMI1
MRRVATSWKVIEGVLKERVRPVYEALRPPADPAKIRELEELLRVKLPRGFVSSLLIHDGMQQGLHDLLNYRSLLPIAGIRSYWRMHCRAQREDGGAGNDYTHTPKIKNDIRWRERWIPVMVTAGGDLQVLDLDPGPAGKRGQLFPWYNNGATAMRVVADSFPQWLDAVAEELVCGRFTVDDLDTVLVRKRLT